MLLALSFACAWIIIGLVGQIDWDAVRDSLTKLAWWQAPVLLLLLVCRQVPNAAPLAFFTEGLGLRRAVQNDQAAIMMSTVSPPPADLVLRLAMFRTWEIPVSKGLAGVLMNTLTFYVIRFSAPVLGLLLVLVTSVPYVDGYAWIAGAGAAVAITLGVVLWAVLRRESAAVWVGTTAGRFSARFPKTVDPEGWAASAVEFRSHVVMRSHRGVPLSLAALTVMVVVDALLLATCLRFVGIPADALSTLAIVAVYLTFYPFTLFPLAGLGVLDALVVAALVDTGGLDLEPELVAGLIVYRVTTLAVPLLFGVGSLAWWRRTDGKGAVDATQ